MAEFKFGYSTLVVLTQVDERSPSISFGDANAINSKKQKTRFVFCLVI